MPDVFLDFLNRWRAHGRRDDGEEEVGGGGGGREQALVTTATCHKHTGRSGDGGALRLDDATAEREGEKRRRRKGRRRERRGGSRAGGGRRELGAASLACTEGGSRQTNAEGAAADWRRSRRGERVTHERASREEIASDLNKDQRASGPAGQRARVKQVGTAGQPVLFLISLQARCVWITVYSRRLSAEI